MAWQIKATLAHRHGRAALLRRLLADQQVSLVGLIPKLWASAECIRLGLIDLRFKVHRELLARCAVLRCALLSRTRQADFGRVSFLHGFDFGCHFTRHQLTNKGVAHCMKQCNRPCHPWFENQPWWGERPREPCGSSARRPASRARRRWCGWGEHPMAVSQFHTYSEGWNRRI
jgi:hypothetical protein